ncbi:hypothetical protein [Candidatus Erwinia haradaeae]|uniref:hypothetical protein n=1 Tax=Candidatus Erwinia haradaeae TaxID=1922217 RepID=UPI0039E6DE9A
MINFTKYKNTDSNLLLQPRHYSLCSFSIDVYFIAHTHKLYICSRNPECSGYEITYGDFTLTGYNSQKIKCEKCG